MVLLVRVTAPLAICFAIAVTSSEVGARTSAIASLLSVFTYPVNPPSYCAFVIWYAVTVAAFSTFCTVPFAVSFAVGVVAANVGTLIASTITIAIITDKILFTLLI